MTNFCDDMEMDMMQLDLFHEPTSRPRALRTPYGVVCPSEHRHVERFIRDTGSLKTAVSIEIAEHCGYWMWATTLKGGDQYSSYRVGPKWGNLAEPRSEAIAKAIDECRTKAATFPDGKKINELLADMQTVGVH
jgi:hypothetical protein